MTPLLLSPFVLAELDCLLAQHVGSAAQKALLALTLDERHFRALRIRNRRTFRLLPADR